jgi:ADP-heptose:LPS heptosyltransferase/predicted SAM-dependent methyltransferase
MVWRATDPQGNEAAKCRYDLVPYLGTTCLDIGCGPHKVFPHFLGLDSGKDTRLFGIEMKPDLVGDCERIPLFADGAFDTVFSSHTLEHIVDHQAALAEWWRLVKVGGHLILYLPHRDLYPNIGTEHGNPDHKHDFVNDDIRVAMVGAAADWTLLVDEKREQLQEYSFLQVYRKEASGAGQHHVAMAPAPVKSAAVVRLGAYGDALWAASILPHLKEQGYHVTMYTETAGAEVLAADPHIDRIVTVPNKLFDDTELMLFFIWEARKYQRFINLTGTVETRLLMHPNEAAYYWSHEARHREMNRNYLEMIHDVAGLPHDFRQKFYPTADERAWAQAERAKLDGPVVVVAPTGSGLPKTWPHTQRFMEIMAAQGVHVIVLGEIREVFTPPEKYGHVAGKSLPIRLAFALAQLADVVVGTESSIINAVAFEPMLKIALLSHSSAENLTKHWPNTAAVEVTGLPCHPCHRLHRAFEFCVRDPKSGFAACQAAVSAESVVDVVRDYLKTSGLQQAA